MANRLALTYRASNIPSNSLINIDQKIQTSIRRHQKVEQINKISTRVKHTEIILIKR